MSIRDAEGQIEGNIPVKNVLVSVSDKSGLEGFVKGLIEVNPDVRFMSTGGTYKKIDELLGESSEKHLIQVSDYTGFPEMEGGLVKTLHPKIHAGLLGERNNPEHQRYLKEDLDNGVYIDMVVVNLYPFKDIVAKIKSGEINPITGRTAANEMGKITGVPYLSMKKLTPVVVAEPSRFTITKLKLKARLLFSLLLCPEIKPFRMGMNEA